MPPDTLFQDLVPPGAPGEARPEAPAEGRLPASPHPVPEHVRAPEDGQGVVTGAAARQAILPLPRPRSVEPGGLGHRLLGYVLLRRWLR